MSKYLNSLTEYIEGRRSTSIGNIMEFYPGEKQVLIDLVKKLEDEKRIRVMNSSCSLDCSSCTTCGSEVDERIRDTTILVSLKLNQC